MTIHRHNTPVTSLYAELLDQLLALQAKRSIAHLPGGFTSKTVHGRRYWYFQYRDLHQSVRQLYIGPDNEATQRLIERFERERPSVEADQQRIEELSAMLRQGGMRAADAATFRVLRALADSGLFRRGAILVGTHAFVALGNLLGLRWAHASAQTQDIDLARDHAVDLALPPDESIDLPEVLEGLEMGFLPVPALDPKAPSTVFKIRGKPLRVDLLTPAKTHRRRPTYFEALNAAAQPLPFLDYLMEQPERAVLIGPTAILVNVPDPARLALHKLVSSQVRTAAFHAKASKELEQAAELLEVLIEDRPADLCAAWSALHAREHRWVKAASGGLERLERTKPALVEAAESLLI